MLTVVESKKLRKLFVLLFLLILSLTLSACGSEGKQIDQFGEYDAITKELKLSVPYTETSSFLTEGAGYATVASLTDGDTTNFRLSTGQFVTIRYYSVNTPESTGQVQKWGKAATLFVKQRLSVATSVVLEATSTPAVHDSYGTRYLGYVWYKINENDDYKLLNLELVENGLSKNTGINTKDYKYYSEFKKAEDFARENKLRLFGNYEDPLYSTSAEKITLKDFYDNTDAYYNSDLDAGSKVRFQAYVTDLKVSGTGTYTYVVKQEVDGQIYNINVYCGYSSSTVVSFNAFTIGNLYSITGNIARHDSEWQVSGIIFNVMESGGDYLTVLQKDYQCTFDSSVEYTSKWGTSLYSDVTVTSAVVDGTNLKIVGETKNNSASGYGDTVSFTFIGNYPESLEISGLVGKTFSVTGMQYVKGSKEISVDFTKISFNN